jgi:hypothetical protein
MLMNNDIGNKKKCKPLSKNPLFGGKNIGPQNRTIKASGMAIEYIAVKKISTTFKVWGFILNKFWLSILAPNNPICPMVSSDHHITVRITTVVRHIVRSLNQLVGDF